jgi:signal transduction histidine kinase/pSer/pThr/pTyr-binding forkhead associated (FHA) protein
VPRVIVIRGADEGKQFELTGSVIGAGRDGSNQIRLHDTEASRRHAEFRQVDGGYCVVDVGSANGTFVNNQPVTDFVLQSGDHVQIGQSVLVYSAGRSEIREETDLADRISLITRQDVELASAIVTSVGEMEGRRILARPEQAGTAWLQTALANLGVMYEAIHSISHILDLDQLLEKIMDLIFKSIDADRGCVMMRNDDTGEFEPKAVRWRPGANAQEKMVVSRTIMDHVLRDKQGVLVSDAARDDRFSSGQSVVRLGIREVICVPMKGRHETLGVLYLDTHSTTREAVLDADAVPEMKFNEDHLKLAIAIAHQAALAVEDTRYHQAMLQAERLAAIGQAMTALSHHIKNILQGLRSGSEILRMGLSEKNDAFLQQGWKIVEKNQGKIYDLVMDMLSYSKEREPAIEETDLNRVVLDVLELLHGRFLETGARLEKRLSDQLPLVAADPEGIHRAVLNIIVNALDALDEREDPAIGVTTGVQRDGKWARIVIQDNGPGIASNKVTEIFRPFVSSKGAKGTGLGLAVSRKIMREHGGDVHVQSQPGKGCKFILRLPIRSPLVNESGGTNNEMPTFRSDD